MATPDGAFQVQCAVCDQWIDRGKIDEELGAVCTECNHVLKDIDDVLDVACHVLGMRPAREGEEFPDPPEQDGLFYDTE